MSYFPFYSEVKTSVRLFNGQKTCNKKCSKNIHISKVFEAQYFLISGLNLLYYSGKRLYKCRKLVREYFPDIPPTRHPESRSEVTMLNLDDKFSPRIHV